MKGGNNGGSSNSDSNSGTRKRIRLIRNKTEAFIAGKDTDAGSDNGTDIRKAGSVGSTGERVISGGDSEAGRDNPDGGSDRGRNGRFTGRGSGAGRGRGRGGAGSDNNSTSNNSGRSGAGSGSDTGFSAEEVPNDENFNGVEVKRRRRKKAAAGVSAELKGMVAQVYAMLYAAPAAMGYGDHWPLAPRQASDLSEATIRCLEGNDSELAEKIIEWLMAMAPIITLIGMLLLFTTDRIRKTRDMFAEQNAQTTPANEGSGSDEYATGSQSAD